KLNLKVMLRTSESGLYVLTAPWRDGLMFSSLSNAMLLYQMVLIEVAHWGRVCTLAWYSKITGKRYWYWEVVSAEGKERVEVKTKGRSAEEKNDLFERQIKEEMERKRGGVVAVGLECRVGEKEGEEKGRRYKVRVLGEKKAGTGGEGGEEVEETVFE